MYVLCLFFGQVTHAGPKSNGGVIESHSAFTLGFSAAMFTIGSIISGGEVAAAKEPFYKISSGIKMALFIGFLVVFFWSLDQNTFSHISKWCPECDATDPLLTDASRWFGNSLNAFIFWSMYTLVYEGIETQRVFAYYEICNYLIVELFIRFTNLGSQMPPETKTEGTFIRAILVGVHAVALAMDKKKSSDADAARKKQ